MTLGHLSQFNPTQLCAFLPIIVNIEGYCGVKACRCNLCRVKSFAAHLPDNPCWLLSQIHLLRHVFRSWLSNLLSCLLIWRMTFSFKVRILIFSGAILLIME